MSEHNTALRLFDAIKLEPTAVENSFRLVPSNPNHLLNMSRFIAVLVVCVLAVMMVGVDAQGRYYFSRNAMPSVVRYQQPVQQSYPVRQNTYAAQQYSPYAANWARPVVSVPQRQPIQQQYRPSSNYYGHYSGENNSGESREVYRRYW